MSKYDPSGQDLEDLLRQVDALLDEPDTAGWDDRLSDEVDLDEYTPAEAREEDAPIFYQNYSNDYGRQVRNYSNGYGGREDAPANIRSEMSIPAYNADFRPQRRTDTKAHKSAVKRTQYPDFPQEPAIAQAPRKQPKPPKAPKRRRGCGCGCLTVLMALVIGVWAVFAWMFQMPQSESSIGSRKRDTATVLLCGTDESGQRTDTMMLLYLSGSEKQVGLLSLPRDTYTIATAGYAAKLNSAYGRNDCGEQGMEALLDYIQDIIGYRPDGYILVDFTIVPQIVDLMGGLEVEVPVEIEVGHISLQPGMQKLNGEEVLTLLRHRSSYAMADLTRVEVQRSVIKACMDQWVSVKHLGKLPDALALIETNSLTSLTTQNYLWMGKTILTGLGSGFSTQTLPGYAEYIGGVSYYLLNRGQVAELINASFNPYEVVIEAADLNIAG